MQATRFFFASLPSRENVAARNGNLKNLGKEKKVGKFLFHESVSVEIFMIFWFDYMTTETLFHRSSTFPAMRFSSRKTFLCAFNSIKIQFPHVGKFTESIVEVSVCVEEILWDEKNFPRRSCGN